MPGKLLSDAVLESDAAVAKVEMPRKQNEKVPLRAEGLGTRQDEGPGAKSRSPGRETRRAAGTLPGRRPAWVSGMVGALHERCALCREVRADGN